MSFKRVGDDHCALRIQKKQRVTDLFAEDIPADEASQTRCGSFVCLVCPHNPVLDTMAMLALHRQGKKHLANMAIKIEKEHDLTDLLQKRKQEMCLKETVASSVPGKCHTQHISGNTCDARPLLERTRRLTKAVIDKTSKSQAKTYKKSDYTELLDGQVSYGKPKKAKPFFQSRVEVHLSRKLDKNAHVNGSSLELSPGKATCSSLPNRTVSLQDKHPPKVCPNLKNKSASKAEKKQSVGNCLKGKETSSEQQRHLELRMSGWILDRDGKWVKDGNVEFDSDEEEP